MVLESANKTLAVTDNCTLTVDDSQSEKEQDASHRFIVHALDPTQADVPIFQISSATNGKYLTSNLTFAETNSTAATYNVTNNGVSKGYSVQDTTSGQYLSFSCGTPAMMGGPEFIKLYSVTF